MLAPAPGPRPDAHLAWDARLAEMAEPSILQTAEWAQLKAAFGWEATSVETDAGMASVLLRPTPLGPLAYLPHGPALRPGATTLQLAELVDAIHQAARAQRAFLLKVEPYATDRPWAEELTALGFHPSDQTVQPRSTAIIDIDPDEDAILAAMRSKTRYNIGLSLRKGVVTREATAADLPAFGELIAHTGERDGFGVHPPEYYERAHALLAGAGLAALLLAEAEGELLAAVMVTCLGATASYLYGASSSERRNLMASYAAQWAGIRWAKAQGCTRYDLWGVPDEVGINPGAYLEDEVPAREGLWGVWRFKRGFAGQVVRRAGAWDFHYRRAASAAYGLAARLRRRIRG